MTRAPVQEFLCAVRRKLWLQATLERLRLGVWAGSLVFLAAAAVNLLGVEITPAIAVFVGLSTALAVTLTALARRPRLAACALHADRIFQTRELMVTALELTTATTTPETPAAIVVRIVVIATSILVAMELHDLAACRTDEVIAVRGSDARDCIH